MPIVNCCPRRYFDVSKLAHSNRLFVNFKNVYCIGGWIVDAWADGELSPSSIYLILCGYFRHSIYVNVYLYIYRVKSCKQDPYGFEVSILNTGVGAVQLEIP